MQKIHKVLVLLLIALFMAAVLSACGKKAGNEKKNDEVAVTPQTNQNDEEGENHIELNKYDNEVLPIEISFPKTDTISVNEDSIISETPDHVLYVFETDTCGGGIVYDEMDMVSLFNTPGKETVVQDALRLKTYTVPQNSEAEIYSDINGMGGFWCKLSDMKLEIKEKETYTGDGFVMVYGMKEDRVGVYVVLGILKNADYDDFSDTDKDNLEVLKASALSLKFKDESSGNYVVWNDTTPDGTKLRAVYKKGVISDIVKTNAGFCLFYGDNKTSYYLVQHFTTRRNCFAEEYLQSIIDGIETEGIVFSEKEEIRGKMVYQKVTMTYTYEGVETQEVVCVSVDEGGSVWLVDLCGTPQDVKDQENNLYIFLWSLREE